MDPELEVSDEFTTIEGFEGIEFVRVRG
jgi:hypothetical protein